MKFCNYVGIPNIELRRENIIEAIPSFKARGVEFIEDTMKSWLEKAGMTINEHSETLEASTP